MRTRQLGKDGPEVPVICFGTWPLGGAFGAIEYDQAVNTLRAGIDAGLTFLDTAESYFDSQAKIGEAIEGRRDEVFLATKVSGSDHSAEHIESALSESLRLLRTDYIDLYQIHSPQPQWPIEDTVGELMKHRDAGKIRYIGVSNFSADQTREAARHGLIHSSQPRYSILFRDSEEEILPTCRELGIGAIVYSVMAKGLLASKYKPGHEFPPDDERHNWPHFKGGTVRTHLRGYGEDEGVGGGPWQGHRAACHRVASGQPCRDVEHRRGTDGRASAARRAGGRLGADGRRPARDRRDSGRPPPGGGCHSPVEGSCETRLRPC